MNNKEEEGKEGITKKEKDEVQVTVSIEHEGKLQKLLLKIGEGFDLAKVTRKQLLAHIIDQAFDSFTEDDIQIVRQNSTTDIALLDQAYREIKKSGYVPESLREYLWKSSQLAQSAKKHRKSRQSENSNAIHKDKEAA
jgi:hypothetical protein